MNFPVSILLVLLFISLPQQDRFKEKREALVKNYIDDSVVKDVVVLNAMRNAGSDIIFG